MTKSTTCLPDVNVWIALIFDGHVHHQPALDWFQKTETDAIAFCRITQMGFLRLLTNSKVMRESVLSQTQAWRHYIEIHQDSRITFLSEPPDLEDLWRSLSQKSYSATHNWTDAYLLAFAKLRGLTFVTFDQSLAKKDIGSILLLP